MSIIRTRRSFVLAATLAIFAAATMQAPGHAASTRSEIDHRQQMMRNSADAASQRAQRERETADRQRQLLQYQIRKNKRMQMRIECRAAGGGTSC